MPSRYAPRLAPDLSGITTLLRWCCSLPVRLLGIAASFVLIAAIGASAIWNAQWVSASGFAVSLDAGILAIGQVQTSFMPRSFRRFGGNDPYTHASLQRKPQLNLDWLQAIGVASRPDRDGPPFYEPEPYKWRIETPLWLPLLGAILATAFAFGFTRRARPSAPNAVTRRHVVAVVGIALLSGSLLLKSGKHIYLGHDYYFAFPGGGLTVGKEVRNVGRYRLSGYAVLLPRYEGPRALEFVGTWTLHIPLWHIGLISGAAAAWMYGAALRRRLPTERCLACGYSLRGLVDNRCPECGSEFAKEKTRATRPGLPSDSQSQ